MTPAWVTNSTSSARRPASTAALRMFVMVCFRKPAFGPPVNTTSVCLPANCVPAPDAVALNSTGVRCLLGEGRCGPSTLK